MKKTLQLANIISFIATVIVNYASNTGAINNTTIGDVSNSLTSLFTPAGYAFSIWGLIYLLLLGFVIYQSRSLFVKTRQDSYILKTGWWFVLSCIANVLWVVFWLYGYFSMSVIAMFVLLYSLIRIVLNNSMELWDAPISRIVFLWWPFVFYSGWVTVASIANVSAYLVSTNWEGWGFSPVNWTLFMIGVATFINLLVTWRRNMREFALVGAWALIAIAVANWDSYESIKITALVAAGILILSSLIHSIKNKETNPAKKCIEYFNNK